MWKCELCKKEFDDETIAIEDKMKKRSENEEFKIPEKKCGDCIHYGIIDYTYAGYGYCRRFPPKRHKDSLFKELYSIVYPIVVWSQHACGEFSRRR